MEDPSVDIVAEDLPEFLSVLNTLQVQLGDSTAHVNQLCEQIEKKSIAREDGLNFLDMKCHLFLEYLINITYFMLLKIDGKPIVGQPCIERLTEIRTVLEKIRPINKKLNYQIEKLVKMAAAKSQESKQHPLSFKPNLDNLVGKNEEEMNSEGDEENSGKIGAYVPPKVTAVPYNEGKMSRKDKRQEKSRQRSLNSSLLQDLRNEYSEVPEEIQNEQNSSKRARLKQKEIERQQYEEDNLKRLTLTKKDKMIRQQLNEMDEVVKIGRFRLLDTDSEQ